MPSARQAAGKTVRILQAHGYTAFFAGGCVRDLILNRKPKDYDIATSALPRQVEAIIPDSKPIGRAFGVIQARIDGYLFEIATFRTDHGSSDGRHPDAVCFSSPRKDAMRRDFTINALFMDPLTGEILDFVNGIGDIRKKIVRCVGSPARRFKEDHLRMLRAVRLSETLRFRLDAVTQSGIRKMAPLIKRISPERVREEFIRILEESPAPGTAMKKLHSVMLLENILPVTCLSSSRSQLTRLFRLMNYIKRSDIAGLLTALTLRTGLTTGANFKNALSVNLHASTKQELQKLCLPGRIIRHILAAQSIYWLIRSTAGRILPDNLPELDGPYAETALEVLRAECSIQPALRPVYERTRSAAAKVRRLLRHPVINGDDLIKAGVEPGPDMRVMLQKARILQAQGEISTKKAMLKRIRQS